MVRKRDIFCQKEMTIIEIVGFDHHDGKDGAGGLLTCCCMLTSQATRCCLLGQINTKRQTQAVTFQNICIEYLYL